MELDILSQLTSFRSHLFSEHPAAPANSPPRLFDSISSVWESCRSSVYVVRVYCRQVIISGLWLYSSPILRWIVPSLHALPWSELVLLAPDGGCISAALEETTSSGPDAHRFLQQLHSQHLSSDLGATRAKSMWNLETPWRKRAAWEWFTLLTLTVFFSFFLFPFFLKMVHIFPNSFPLGGEK